MGNKEVVRKLLDRGIMVSPGTLERMKNSSIGDFLGTASSSRCAVISEDDGATLKCSVAPARPPAELTTGDVAAAQTEKFEKIRKMILRKVSAVSINNAGRQSSKLCIVGMVKEKTGSGFVIEDGTGEIEVRSDEPAEPDDVIGVKGWVRDGRLFAEETVYPDVPMSREAGALPGSILLSFDPGAKPSGPEVVISPFSVAGGGADSQLPNPAWICLEKGGSAVTMLVYRADGPAGKQAAISWLRKRYIGPDRLPAPSKDRILESVPDIFWVVGDGGSWRENYKGVTILSLGKGCSARIDLGNKEVSISDAASAAQAPDKPAG